MTLQYRFASAIGPLFLVASDLGLQGVYWEKKSVPLTKDFGSTAGACLHLEKTVRELTEYFAGERKKFTIKLDINGTEFQKKVWSELTRIPFGKTISYRELAKKIENESAVRAVGTANGKNPLCVIIPCHRVIAADGSLGGYSGGLDRKTRLLELEK